MAPPVRTFPNIEKREAAVSPTTWDAEARTIEVVFSAGATVRRYGWLEDFDEELVVDEASVNLDRANNGAPFLLQHRGGDPDALIGNIVDGTARVEGGEVVGTVRFVPEETAIERKVEPYIQEIAQGFRRNVSIGYTIQKRTVLENDGAPDLHRIDQWTILEGSAVNMGADDAAGFRTTTPPTEDRTMLEKTPDTAPANVVDLTDEQRAEARAAGEAAAELRITETHRLAQRAGLDVTDERVAKMLADKTPLDGANGVRAQLLDIEATEDEKRGVSGTHAIDVGTQEPEKVRGAMECALLHRAFPGAVQLENDAQDFRYLSPLDMGREMLDRRGMRTRGMSKPEVARLLLGLETRAGFHSTSDFPLLTANVASKSLQMGFNETPVTYEPFTSRRDLPDFKTHHDVKRSKLEVLAESAANAAVTYGTITEGEETWSLAWYKKGLLLGWQLLVNDDLGALNVMTREVANLGDAARRTRSNVFWTNFTTQTLADTKTVFHADHDNLVTGGSTPSPAQYDKMEQLFAAQLDLDGVTPIDVDMRFVLFGAATRLTHLQLMQPLVNETVADRMVTQYVPIYERRLTGTSYYGAAAVGQNKCFWGTLQGMPNPVVTSTTDFDTSGIKMKVEDTFGAFIGDYRGLVKNPGA
jgi:hypothetical protein